MNIMTGFRAAMQNPIQAFLSRVRGSRRGPQHEARCIVCHPMPRRAPEPALSGTNSRFPIVDDGAPLERPSGLTDGLPDWPPDCLHEWRDDPSLRALFHPVVCKPEYSCPFRKYIDGKVSLYCSKSWYYVPLLRREFSDIHSAAQAVDLYYATEAKQFDGGPDKTCSQY